MDMARMDDDEILSRVLYRDAMMLVVNKPYGVPVHPGTGGGVTMTDYFDGLRYGLPQPPALAHRLDRETSGCLVLGRHRQALKTLGQLFAAGRIEKTYWAVVIGTPAEAEGVIDLPLGKQAKNSYSWRMRHDPDGQPARTEYEWLGGDGTYSWLALRPKTGRTHQLRVHCAELGTPILGDRIYGGADEAHRELHLHARAVSIPLYPKRDPILVEAPCPPALRSQLKRFARYDASSDKVFTG